MKISVDAVKRWGQLGEMVPPVAITATTVLNNFKGAKDAIVGVGKALFHTNLRGAYHQANGLSNIIFRPGGVAGWAVNSALACSSAIDFTIGVTELSSGIKNKNKYLVGVGVSDLIISALGPMLIAGFGLSAIGVALFGAVAKAGVTYINRKEASTVQKADSIFSLLGYASTTALKAGVATLPATVISIGSAITELAFLSSKYANDKPPIKKHP